MMINRVPDFVYGSVRVFSSELATQTMPNKQHKKSVSMSESYHRRIQKKWLKRFGTKQGPGAYQVGPDCLVMHPDLVDMLKQDLAGGAQ